MERDDHAGDGARDEGLNLSAHPCINSSLPPATTQLRAKQLPLGYG